MDTQTIVLLVILVPLIGSLLVPLIRGITKSDKIREWYAVLVALLSNVLAWTLLPTALEGETTRIVISVWAGLDMILVVDALSVFMAITASFLSLMIVLYSIGYMAKEKHLNEYYLMVLLFIGSMMGLVFSAHLIYLYIFWEISSLCSWRLISFYRKKEYVEKGVKAFLMTFAGAALMALGFLLIYMEFGTFDLTALQGAEIGGVIVLLILFGILSKSATVPLHTWLPDAGVAPSTVTSLLHAAVLVKIGIYAFARLFGVTFELGLIAGYDWQTIILWVLAISAFISACAALSVNNIKKILAYSTVSQLAFILIGLAALNEEGYKYALFYILAHGVAKAGLFLCAGIIEHATHTKDITQMGGLSKKLPWTMAAFGLCALSIMGIIPFAGYWAKHGVFEGVIEAGFASIAWVAFFVSLLTMMYLARPFALVFLGKPRSHHAEEAHQEGTKGMVAVVVFLGVLSFLLGIFNVIPRELIKVATEQSLFYHAYHLVHHVTNPVWISEFNTITLVIQVITFIGILEILRRKAKSEKLPGILQADVTVIRGLANVVYEFIERMIDRIGGGVISYTGQVVGGTLQTIHNGVLQNYVFWVLGGMALIVYILVR